MNTQNDMNETQDEFEEEVVEIVDDEAAEEEVGDAHQPFPSALGDVCFKSWTYAGLIFLVTCILLGYFRTVQCAIGYIFCGYFIYNAWSIKRDYYRGNITERATVCSSVTNNLARNASRVIFRRDGEDGSCEYYEFYVPGLKNTNDSIEPNGKYIIYFRNTDARRLLAYLRL